MHIPREEESNEQDEEITGSEMEFPSQVSCLKFKYMLPTVIQWPFLFIIFHYKYKNTFPKYYPHPTTLNVFLDVRPKEEEKRNVVWFHDSGSCEHP